MFHVDFVLGFQFDAKLMFLFVVEKKPRRSKRKGKRMFLSDYKMRYVCGDISQRGVSWQETVMMMVKILMITMTRLLTTN